MDTAPATNTPAASTTVTILVAAAPGRSTHAWQKNFASADEAWEYAAQYLDAEGVYYDITPVR